MESFPPLQWEVGSLRTPQCVQSEFVSFLFVTEAFLSTVETGLSLPLQLLQSSLLCVFPLEQWVWELIYHPDFVTLDSRMKIVLKQRRESCLF